MAQITKPIAYRVDIIESERGWGGKLVESIYFDNEEEARKYAMDYNTKYNTFEEVPDWYMVAEYCGKV